MQSKDHFLDRLAARLEAAQKRSQADPDDLQAEMYAKSLGLLYDDFADKPADHLLFRQWDRGVDSDGTGSSVVRSRP